MIDDTKLKTGGDSTETDSANKPVRKKKHDDNAFLPKKDKWFIIVVIVIAIIIGGLSPFIIDIESPNKKSEITADGLLGYIVSFISAAVTAVLALYAIRQTKQANEMTKRANDMADQTLQATIQATEAAKSANEIAEKANAMTEQADKKANELTAQANIIAEKMLEIEKSNYITEMRPFIMITDYEIKFFNKDKICNEKNITYIQIQKNCVYFVPGIYLNIINSTNSFITVKYSGIEEIDESESSDNIEFCNVLVNQIDSKFMLNANQTGSLVLYANKDFLEALEGKKVRFSFILENKYAQRYRETIDVNFFVLHEMNKGVNWHYHFFVDNYRFYKFIDQNNYVEEDL